MLFQNGAGVRLISPYPTPVSPDLVPPALFEYASAHRGQGRPTLPEQNAADVRLAGPFHLVKSKKLLLCLLR